MTGESKDTSQQVKQPVKALDRIKAVVFTPEFRMFLCLVLLLRVNLVLKIAGLVLAFLLEPDLKFKLRSGRLPLFYVTMAGLVALQILINFYRGTNYIIVASLAGGFWIVSLLVVHQVVLWCERYEGSQVRRALVWFFTVNAVITFGKLLSIMLEIGEVNPYQYVGENFRYFASTGDYLRGITGDISTVNMVLSSFGAFYFLYHRYYVMSLLCFMVATVTTSNVGNFVLAGFLLLTILTHPKKLVKSIALCYIVFLASFVTEISPSNLNYLNNKVTEIFNLPQKPITIRYEDHSEKDRLISMYVQRHKTLADTAVRSKKRVGYLIALSRQKEIEQDSAATRTSAREEAQSRAFYTQYFENLFGDTLKSLDRAYYAGAPGKLISFKESVQYAMSGPLPFILGAGAGNFSSRIAYKATNLGFSGRYFEKLTYVAPEFRDHHLKLTLRYYMLPLSEHSVINFPNSVFNQIIGEYGFVGLMLFLVLYIGFFAKRFRFMKSTRLLFLMLLVFLMLDYWFESLSIVVMFELMAFSEIKERMPHVEAE